MSRIISRIVAVGAGNVDGVRVSEPDDMTLPGLLPGPRLFVHRLRTTHGLVATAFEWAQLAVFLATSRVAVIPRLGISLGVAGGLALIRLATAAKWEVVIEAMSTSFIISYLIQLIAAAASANAANVLVDWVGAITQLAVAFMLSLACLAPLHHPFVREKVVEGMWRNGAPYATKRERWDASGPGTPLYKPALSLTILWIVVFLIVGWRNRRLYFEMGL